MQMSRRLPLSGAHLSAHLQRLVEPQGMNLEAPYLADALKAACMRVFESRAEARAFLDSVRRASAALHLLLFPWGWLLLPRSLLPCSCCSAFGVAAAACGCCCAPGCLATRILSACCLAALLSP